MGVNQKLFKFGVARLLVDRGDSFESATAFQGHGRILKTHDFKDKCGGHSKPIFITPTKNVDVYDFTL